MYNLIGELSTVIIQGKGGVIYLSRGNGQVQADIIGKPGCNASAGYQDEGERDSAKTLSAARRNQRRFPTEARSAVRRKYKIDLNMDGVE